MTELEMESAGLPVLLNGYSRCTVDDASLESTTHNLYQQGERPKRKKNERCVKSHVTAGILDSRTCIHSSYPHFNHFLNDDQFFRQCRMSCHRKKKNTTKTTSVRKETGNVSTTRTLSSLH